MNDIIDFLTSRQWNIYPFIPPLFSLIVSFSLVPVFNKLYAKNLQRFLELNSLTTQFVIINGIAQDLSLQIRYLTGLPACITSLVATLKSDHPILLTTVLLILLIPMLILLLQVLLQEPAYHSTTRFPENHKYMYFFSKGWTYLKVYKYILALFNILLLIIALVALPKKP